MDNELIIGQIIISKNNNKMLIAKQNYIITDIKDRVDINVFSSMIAHPSYFKVDDINFCFMFEDECVNDINYAWKYFYLPSELRKNKIKNIKMNQIYDKLSKI